MDIPYPQRKEIEYFLRENLPVGASDQDIPAERLQSVRFRAYFLRLKDRQAPFERERFDGRGREDSLPPLRLVRLNDDARDAKYRHGDIVWAERQTAGRGQRGHKWSSAEGLNLTFSLVLEPRFLPAGEQFLLNEAVALALTDTFAQFGIAARIKWTNDIYAGDKKLVGILIEHSYSGQTLARTIVGIGINVNQTEFDPALPNPVSMAMVAGRTFDRGEVLEAFRRHIGIRYAQLELDERETLQRDYRERMYRLGERHTFRYPDGTPTEASIEGVRPTGELLLRHADGTLREYLFKEIEFVIAGK